MSGSKTIAFFPEAAFGPALNSVGIAQACRELGHKPVFIRDADLPPHLSAHGEVDRDCLARHRSCRIERDEFCHFLTGRCSCTDEAGAVTNVDPDTLAFFPAGWKGTCRVTETVRKVYMIR